MDAMVTASKTFIGASACGISNAVRLTAVQLAAVNAAGHFETDAKGAYVRTLVDFSSAPTTGGSVHATEPPQAALVVSLNTSRTGRVGRGRFYLPMPCFPSSPTDLLISDAAAHGVALAASTWIKALNDAAANGSPPQGPRVCVASGGSVKNAVPPGNYEVTSVRVGRVVDTVRSRRNALDEAYSANVAI
jgi:hypothetical protein